MRPLLSSMVVLSLALSALLGALGASCARDEHRVEVRQGDCYTCHEPEYAGTMSPPHAGLFETSCGDCHTTTSWLPTAAIVHDWFVLRNRHATEHCSACHTVGYRPGDTPPECSGCHMDDYDATTTPPHVGYPTDCAGCHTDAGWVPSTFAHGWALTGAHASTPCASCHGGSPPVYRGTPRECVGCHRADYDASPYPGHSGFPTTCADCHSTTGWTPAMAGVHPESRFTIATGAHSPFQCLDCHDPALGPATAGMNTDCIGCHTGQHERARVDEQHREVSRYPVGDPNPHFCLSCHPAGRH